MSKLNIYNKKLLREHMLRELKSISVEVARIEENKIYIVTRYMVFIIPQYVYKEYFENIFKSDIPDVGKIKYFNSSGECKGSDTVQNLKSRIDIMLAEMTIPLCQTNYIEKIDNNREIYIFSAAEYPVFIDRKFVDIIEEKYDNIFINEKGYNLYIEFCGIKNIIFPIRKIITPIENFIVKGVKNE